MSLRDSAEEIVRTLRGAGHTAYFVGGCVRDMILGVEPHDIDVATDARPRQIVDLFEQTREVGAQFGVVLVCVDGDWSEVATFRSDLGYSDGRRPDDVAFTDAEGDVRRRDFTINGLLYDPVEGEIIDHVGGRADIEAGVVRCIGDPKTRFEEDKLRLLRAVRFAARLEYTIEPATFKAMRAAAPSVTVVSPERIGGELLTIFTAPHADRGLELLDAAGLLEPVLPEVYAMKGVPQPPEFHPEGDVFEHTAMMLGLMDGPSPELALAVLLHDIGKPPTFEVADRIRFNRHDRKGAELANAVCRRLRM
ncbi:MAG: CCA tRNA nucleotidyltransferase, partial [Planctomycetota bacterium]